MVHVSIRLSFFRNITKLRTFHPDNKLGQKHHFWIQGMPLNSNFKFSAKKSIFRWKNKFRLKKIFLHHFLIQNFDFFFIKFDPKNDFSRKYQYFMKYFDKKNHWKALENDDFCIKIINFDQFCKKKKRLAASPLPGVTLSGEHASGGPLRGG